MFRRVLALLLCSCCCLVAARLTVSYDGSELFSIEAPPFRRTSQFAAVSGSVVDLTLDTRAAVRHACDVRELDEWQERTGGNLTGRIVIVDGYHCVYELKERACYEQGAVGVVATTVDGEPGYMANSAWEQAHAVAHRSGEFAPVVEVDNSALRPRLADLASQYATNELYTITLTDDSENRYNTFRTQLQGFGRAWSAGLGIVNLLLSCVAGVLVIFLVYRHAAKHRELWRAPWVLVMSTSVWPAVLVVALEVFLLVWHSVYYFYNGLLASLGFTWFYNRTLLSMPLVLHVLATGALFYRYEAPVRLTLKRDGEPYAPRWFLVSAYGALACVALSLVFVEFFDVTRHVVALFHPDVPPLPVTLCVLHFSLGLWTALCYSYLLYWSRRSSRNMRPTDEANTLLQKLVYRWQQSEYIILIVVHCVLHFAITVIAAMVATPYVWHNAWQSTMYLSVLFFLQTLTQLVNILSPALRILLGRDLTAMSPKEEAALETAVRRTPMPRYMQAPSPLAYKEDGSGEKQRRRRKRRSAAVREMLNVFES